MVIKPIELGCSGHLIVAAHCRWRRHTQVGNYRVSTVGEYYPPNQKHRDTVGSGEHDFFETEVFETTQTPVPNNDGCGCREVASWSELDCRRYRTAGEAQAGHEKLVQKYLKRARVA